MCDNRANGQSRRKIVEQMIFYDISYPYTHIQKDIIQNITDKYNA